MFEWRPEYFSSIKRDIYYCLELLDMKYSLPKCNPVLFSIYESILDISLVNFSILYFCHQLPKCSDFSLLQRKKQLIVNSNWWKSSKHILFPESWKRKILLIFSIHLYPQFITCQQLVISTIKQKLLDTDFFFDTQLINPTWNITPQEDRIRYRVQRCFLCTKFK